MESESERYSEHQSTTESVEENLRLNQEPCGEKASVCSDAHTGVKTVSSHPTSAPGDSRESPRSEESGSPSNSVGFSENGLHGHTLEAYLSDFGSSSSSGSDLGSMSHSCMERLIGRLESPSLDSAIKTPEEEEDVEDDRCPSLFQVSMMTASTADSLPCTPTLLSRHAECISEEPEEGAHKAHHMHGTAEEATVIPPKASGSSEGDSRSLKFGITGEASSTPDACSSHVSPYPLYNLLGGAVDDCEKDNNKADVSRTTLDYTADDDDPDRCPSTFCVSADVADSLPECLLSADDKAGRMASMYSTVNREEFCNEERSTSGVCDKNLVDEPAQPGFDRKLQLNVCMSESLTGPNSQILSKEHLEVLQLFGLSETESSTVKTDSPDSDIELLSLSQDDSMSALQQDQSDHMRQSHLEPSAHSVPSVSESCEEDTHLTPVMDHKTPGNNANYLQDGYLFNMEDPNLLKDVDGESDMSVDSPCHSPQPDAQVQMKFGNQQAHEKKDTDRRMDACCLDHNTKVSYLTPEDGATEKRNFDPECSINPVTDFSMLGLPGKISAGDNQVRAARDVLSNQARGQGHSEDNESVRGAVNVVSNTDVRGLSPGSQDCSFSGPDPSCTQTSQRGNNAACRPIAAPRKGPPAISAGSFPVNKSFAEAPMASSGVSSLPGVPENQRALFRATDDDSQKNDDDFGRPSAQEQNYERDTSEPHPLQGHINTEPFLTRPMSSAQNTFEQGKFGSHSEDHRRQFAGTTCTPAEQFPGRGQTGPAFSGINTDAERFAPQPQNFQVCAADQAGVTVLKQKTQDWAAVTPSGGRAAEPSHAPGAQGLQLSGLPGQTSITAQGGNLLSAQHDRHLSSPQQQVHQELSTASERKDLKLAPQGVESQRRKQAPEDLQETVMVTGVALEEEDEEICNLYFENEKRSGGGEIGKDCLWWDEKRKCFFITFIDSQVAKQVAAREHALKSHPVQVEVCPSPPTPRAKAAPTPSQSGGRPSQPHARAKTTPLPAQPGRRSATSTNAASEYRVKVSGLPSGTSSDCLQNYLECVSDISVTSIALSKDRNSAVVTMSSSGDEPDLSSMNSTCRESPLEEGSLMSFGKVSPSCVVQVTGLKTTTANEAVQFFFSNRRRNHGGPVEKVERSQDKTSALVHFIKHEDAEAVVKKGSHSLDNSQLCVTLHEEADNENESDESEGRRSVSSMDGESFRRPEPSSDDEYTADQEGKAAQFSKGGMASRDGEYAKGNTDFSSSDRHHESAMSRDKDKDQYSSSASAQMKHREEYDERMGDSARSTDGYTQQEGSRYREDPSKALKRQTDGYRGQTDGYRGQTDGYRGQTDGYRGQADSGLIDSFRSPKKDKNEFKEEERMERAPSNQYSSGSNNTMFDCGNLRPTAASSTKTSSETCCTRQKHDTVINLGDRTMRRITGNPVLLRELTTKVKSVGGRFRWLQPDQMIVTCLLEEPAREWEEAVHKKVNHFLALLPQHERRAAEKENPTPPIADSSTREYRDNPESDDDMLKTNTPLSRDSKPVNAELSISGMQDDEIPNLKPCQFKILCIPAALEKFYRDFPGLQISVDKERRTAKVSAPEDKMKKAFSDVLAFAMYLKETKMPLTPGLLKMFEREDAKEWIQETVISEHGLVCHWEVSEKQIIISGHLSDLDRIHQMFKEAFKEKTIKLEPDEACTLKSPAWRSFLEQLEDSDIHPQPVLLPQGDSVIIVHTPSNISTTELKLKKFLRENKQEVKTLEISPNRVKLLQEFCDHDLKELGKKAKDVGVNISFNKNGLKAQGPKDCLPGVLGEVREMVGRIKEDKMTFKKPGMARYLTGRKGQDFLTQAGSVTKCYITTGGGGDGASQSGSRVLAKAQLSPTLHLKIIQGDITQCAVDAIVNAANGRLKHDGGVAAAIVKAGGRCIQEESDELVAEHGELNDGEVMVTEAGTLPCSHVIHAVGPVWSGGTKGEEKALIQTVKSILKEAEKMKLTSVAIPAISCGIFRYPVDQATSTIMKTIAQFLQKERDLSLQTVVLIDMGADPLRGFISAGKLLFGKRLEEKDTPTSAPPRGKHSGGSYHKPTERTERDSHRSHPDHGHDETSQGPIKIIPGEIAKSKTDVIVCTTHPSLDLQKGVLSKSIAREGGDAIQQELKKYHEKFGAAELGHVVRTSGGNLRCKLVFHLSLPSWRDDHGKAMKSAVKGCLDEASKRKQRSIAFPSLGTGRLGYPSDKVASIMQSAISQWFSDNHRTSLKEAQIIVFPKDTETLQAFKDNDKQGGGHSGGRGHGHRGGRGGDADYSGGPSNCKVKVGKMTVTVKEGDILAESCDAIVNSSNDSLDLTKGVVSKAILKACGQDIVLECSKQKDEMGENGVVVTRVDGLASCRHVIHVSADRFKGDWTEGILAVLRLAEEEGIRSVAMPALGTGGKGANPEKLAQAMQEAVKEFSRESKSVKEVNVVVFQKQMMRPYISTFDPDASSSSTRGADRSDSGDGASADRGEKRQTHAADVFIYSLQHSAIKEAREKIHRHMTSIFTSKTETNPVIASFNPKQKDEMFKLQKKHNVEISLDDKKGAVTFTGIDIDVTSAVSELKDIILSATTQRHLAAGGPPVRWQYQTGKDKFADFDPETNLTVEAAFKKKEPSVQFSDKRGRRYKIVFRDKKEYSVDDRSAQPVTVKRRDIMEEKKRDIPLPDHWEPMKGDKVKQVQLKSDSSEYKRVAGHFGRQGQASIKKIERIQNPSLFQQYKIKKREIEQNNPKGTENEKRLFHGTSSDSIKGIVTNGFNRSYCGKNGTALGNGVYFAADSATSMGYAAQGGQMFQARVLVGEYTQGNSGMRMAPQKPKSNRPYDSVSNGPPPNATVFVIFHDCQAYPEYLISF